MIAAEVTEIRNVAPPAGEVVLGGRIEQPFPGFDTDRHVLEVSGWVVGASCRAVRVEVLSHGEVIHSIAVGRFNRDALAQHPDRVWASTAGYSGTVGTLDLGAEFELELHAVLEDGATAVIGTVVGFCEPLSTGYDAVYQPLLVTTLGRSGSTFLMHLLAQAVDIAVGMDYPYEMRIGKYLLHLLALATSPADHELSATRDAFAASAFWAGRNPFNDDHAGPLREWFETESVRELAAFTQWQIDQAYSIVAGGRDEATRPRYFAEKTGPDRLCRLAHRIYPGSRELFLVRDFRDVYCSVDAFNRKRGYVKFGRESAPDDRGYLHQLGEGALQLLASWQLRAESALLVRYEELVSDPAGMIARIFDYLSLSPEVPGNEPAEIVSRADALEGGLTQHRTAASAAESIGRWRSELPLELRDTCAEALDEPLTGFGYEPTL